MRSSVPAAESLFDPPTDGTVRIACLAGARFPDPAHAHAYATAERIGRLWPAEVRFWHWVSVDPRAIPPDLRTRVGTGFMPRLWYTLYDDTRRHLRATRPDHFRSMLERLQRHLAVDQTALLTRWDVRIGCEFARLVQGWRADVLMTWAAGKEMVAASVASELLQIPHVVFVSSDADAAAVRLLPTDVDASGLVLVCDSDAVRARALTLRPDLPGDRAWLLPAGDGGIAELVASLRTNVAARPPTTAPLGPRAAFLSPPRPVDPDPEPRSVPVRRPNAKPARLFAVLTTERTGSNLLVNLLAAQPHIACAGELFNPRLIDQGTVPWIASGAPLADLAAVRHQGPRALLARLVDDATAQARRLVGFKLMYDHAAIDTRTLDAICEHPDVPVVHLLRRDRLARFLSHQIAKQTDQWSETGGGATDESMGGAARPRLAVRIDELLDDFASTELLEHRFRALFRDHPVLELDYDDVVSRPAAVADALTAFLGETVLPAAPRSRKTGRPAEDTVDDFAALRESLHGTRWQHLLGAAAEPGAPAEPEPHDYYQSLDFPHFNYRPVDVPGGGPRPFRGPVADRTGSHVACIGAAQTFGRFAHRPFPALLESHVHLPCLNLGLGGVGPRFWCQPELLALLSQARVAVVQVMAGRSASNSLFDNSEGGDLMGCVRATGERMRFEQFLEALVREGDPDRCRQVIDETRDDYVDWMRRLAGALPQPTVLLWISRRQPAYQPDWRDPHSILQQFPQLVDQAVIDRLRPSFDAYVECVSDAGLPQRLWPAAAPVDGTRLGADGHLYNDYYPSPDMHMLAADLLAPVVRRLLDRPPR